VSYTSNASIEGLHPQHYFLLIFFG
jgi:hypothetical protein